MSRAWLSRLGLPGVAGIGLWLFCLSFGLGNLLPLEEQAAELRTTAQDLKRKLAALPSGEVKTIDHNDHAALSDGEVPDVIERLDALIAQDGISAEHTSYRIDTRNDRRRIEVSLPVKGNYPALRAYLRDALALGEQATLDELRLQRGQATDALVDADLRLSYYIRP